ncbi:MAG: hypothetical protein U9P14_10040 [Gemmatimonadota bacterium]|nr:hypothetical protein [Gemmatimonadota bacterium]
MKVGAVIDRKLDMMVQLKKVNDEANEMLDSLKDNPGLKVKVMAEIRNQIKLQLDIFKTMYSLREAEVFQETVLE